MQTIQNVVQFQLKETFPNNVALNNNTHNSKHGVNFCRNSLIIFYLSNVFLNK